MVRVVSKTSSADGECLERTWNCEMPENELYTRVRTLEKLQKTLLSVCRSLTPQASASLASAHMAIFLID